MPAPRLSPQLLDKLANKTGKSKQYLREQISKSASRRGVSSEAVLVNRANKAGISAGRYLNSLSADIREEVRALNGTDSVGARSGNTRPAVAYHAKNTSKSKSSNRPWWENPIFLD